MFLNNYQGFITNVLNAIICCKYTNGKEEGLAQKHDLIIINNLYKVICLIL